MTLTRETVEKLLECGPLRTQLETKLCAALLAAWDERDAVQKEFDAVAATLTEMVAGEQRRAEAAEAKLAEVTNAVAAARDMMGRLWAQEKTCALDAEAKLAELDAENARLRDGVEVISWLDPEVIDVKGQLEFAISAAKTLLNKEPKP